MSIQSFGPFRVNRAQRLIEKNGESLIIGGRALDLLIALMDRAGTIVSVRDLMTLVWPNLTVEEANLRVCISVLRKALNDGVDGARYIVNVPGRGYTFVAPLEIESSEGCTSEYISHGAAGSHLLPEIPETFVGRHDDVDNLSRLIMSQRFVSVVGPGGIGKTTVALAVASALRSEFCADSVCFVDCGAIGDADDLPTAVVSALRCPVPASDPLTGIRAFLAEKRTLLILDGCEQVIETAASLSEYLFQSNETVHLLTTSREILRVHGENVYLLPPLRYPVGEMPTAHQALATPAVQLFMGKAAASGHRESLSDEDAPIVSSMCRRLDGIALAIELVASRVGVYGIHGTVDLLDSGAELVLQGRRDAPPRHQTLQALHDWSYRLLSAKEQTIFARLSMFVGDMTLEAAHAVVGDGVDDRRTISQVVASLGDKSLIHASSVQGPPRYRLLDTTRAYASLKLADRGEKDEIARRHALYFMSVLERIANRAPSIDSGDVAGLTLSVGDIRSAIAWSFSCSGDPVIGRRLTASAARLSLDHAFLRECRAWGHQSLWPVQDANHATSVDLQHTRKLSLTDAQINREIDQSTATRDLQLALGQPEGECRFGRELAGPLHLIAFGRTYTQERPSPGNVL